MKTLTFSVLINAAPARVWDVLWTDETYRRWTSPFHEGSYAQSDWNEGSKILFLDGQGNGMVSKIAKSTPPQLMIFEHLGEMKNGVEDFDSPEVKAWAGASERYTLTDKGGQTELVVEVDVAGGFESHFTDAFPKAMAMIKEMAEG